METLIMLICGSVQWPPAVSSCRTILDLIKEQVQRHYNAWDLGIFRLLLMFKGNETESKCLEDTCMVNR